MQVLKADIKYISFKSVYLCGFQAQAVKNQLHFRFVVSRIVRQPALLKSRNSCPRENKFGANSAYFAAQPAICSITSFTLLKFILSCSSLRFFPQRFVYRDLNMDMRRERIAETFCLERAQTAERRSVRVMFFTLFYTTFCPFYSAPLRLSESEP